MRVKTGRDAGAERRGAGVGVGGRAAKGHGDARNGAKVRAGGRKEGGRSRAEDYAASMPRWRGVIFLMPLGCTLEPSLGWLKADRDLGWRDG